MRLFQLVSCVICACVIVLRVNDCCAQADTPVELTWEAPKGCPQELEVQQQLRTLLGVSTNDQTSHFQAHGTIEPVDGRYRLSLFIGRTATHGTRIIESDDCRSLAKAATVVLLLLVNKEKTLGRELSESEIVGQPAQPQQTSTTSAAAPVKEIHPAEPTKPSLQPQGSHSLSLWHLLLRAPEARVDFTTLPTVGYGLGLGIGVAYRAWQASIRGTAYKTESVTSHGFPPYQVQYHRESLDALGCYGWRSGLFEVAPCGDLAADRVFAHVAGDSLVSKDKTALWISIGGGISGYLHVYRHAALVAMATGRVTTNRVTFQVENLTGLHQAQKLPLATFDTSLACEWIF